MVTLVLLPGMDGTGRLFDDFRATLWPGAAAMVIRYPPAQALDYAALETLVLSQLPKDAPYVLLGESFSGPIAVAIAARGAPNCVGLILCCSFVRNPRPALAWLRPLLARAPLHLAPLGLLSRLLLGPRSSAAQHAAVAGAVAEVAPHVMRARMLSVLSLDATEPLGRVALPLLYLRAGRDRVVPRSAAALVARLNGRTQIVEIDGPHCLLQTFPATAVSAIYPFIRQIEAALETAGPA
ncbi:alpha/beta fold hydrolase [Janthinobacterium fluminis]|uniref:Alpha/beta hydrolase n=1 Tax=Janthinobacterium fluminis TaxID=2987524 RepID=A0ABT5K780_9BURK|nr:alpha/beta hydrolase [Janthinobacterium fluminis]MDC8760862.1 alpha/beta hydrolase [Janthinobacterium fluminis]